MTSTVMNGTATATPRAVLAAIVAGINSGDVDGLMSLYESDAAFATEPGTLAAGAGGHSAALDAGQASTARSISK